MTVVTGGRACKRLRSMRTLANSPSRPRANSSMGLNEKFQDGETVA